MGGNERHTVRDSDSQRGTNPLRLDRRQQVEGRADLIGEAALVPMGSSPKVFSHALAIARSLFALCHPRALHLGSVRWSLRTAGTTTRAAAMSGGEEAFEDMFAVVRWVWQLLT